MKFVLTDVLVMMMSLTAVAADAVFANVALDVTPFE